MCCRQNSKTDHKLRRNYFLRVYTRCFCSEDGKFSKASKGFQELTQDLLLWRKQELSHQKKKPAFKPIWISYFRAAQTFQKGLWDLKIPLITSCVSWEVVIPGPVVPQHLVTLRGDNRPFHCFLPSAFLSQSPSVTIQNVTSKTPLVHSPLPYPHSEWGWKESRNSLKLCPPKGIPCAP